MKKHSFLLPAVLFPLLLAAQADWKNLKITPAKPKPGETIRIEYKWLEGPVARAGDIQVLALEYDGEKPISKDISPQNIGNSLVASFPVSLEARVVYVAFQGGDFLDNNAGEGFFIPMHNAAGLVLPESKAAQAALYRASGPLELNRKAEVALELFQQAFTQQFDLRGNPKYFPAYASAYLNVNRNSDEAKAEILKMLAELENDSKADEKTLTAIAELYTRMAPEKSKALKDRVMAAYPQGALSRAFRLNPLKTEPDPTKRMALLNDFAKQSPPESEQDRETMAGAYLGIARMAAEQKNWNLFTSAAAQLQGNDRASAYNNVAWGLAEKNDDLNRAKMLASEATEWARIDLAVPSEPKPATTTQKNWEQQRENTYAMYADTYAYILDKSGDAQAAARYQAEAVEMNDYGNVEFNERFTAYLERAGLPDLRHQLEGFILKGAASEKMKEQFKKCYLAQDNSSKGFEAYLAALEQVARNNLRAELRQKMLDQPAPAFSLKNLEGKTISLESLRGKTVVIDFWATWCGPCKSSFPGMQQAIEKHKSDPNVAFLFVDTWERVDNKEKNASDFIKNSQYTFNVLMDNDNKVVASYGVPGIPTKFVVDKYGKIRFKSVGFAGSPDALVEEISLMIEVAKGVL